MKHIILSLIILLTSLTVFCQRNTQNYDLHFTNRIVTTRSVTKPKAVTTIDNHIVINNDTIRITEKSGQSYYYIITECNNNPDRKYYECNDIKLFYYVDQKRFVVQYPAPKGIMGKQTIYY